MNSKHLTKNGVQKVPGGVKLEKDLTDVINVRPLNKPIKASAILSDEVKKKVK